MASDPEIRDAEHDSQDRDYAYFCRKVTELTGINLHNYKSNQMHRRLVAYMRRNQIPNFIIFAECLVKANGELDKLVDYLTINVSEFFRNAGQWELLSGKVIPALADVPARKTIRAWSAGCSAGQEAYSIAITFAEMGRPEVSILGTDIDEPSLKKAREGKYLVDEVKGVPDMLLQKYFRHEGNLYAASDMIRRMVRFKKHNLLGPDYPENMDLILCRNVLIYFTDEGKGYVISKMSRSLRPGGVLFMGATEAIFNCKDYGLGQIYPFFYQRLQ